MSEEKEEQRMDCAFGVLPEKIKKGRRELRENLLKISMEEFFWNIGSFYHKYIFDAFFCIAAIEDEKGKEELNNFLDKAGSKNIAEINKFICACLEKYIPEIKGDRIDILTKMFYKLTIRYQEEDGCSVLLPVSEALIDTSNDWV